jgi:hypothetical protein
LDVMKIPPSPKPGGWADRSIACIADSRSPLTEQLNSIDNGVLTDRRSDRTEKNTMATDCMDAPSRHPALFAGRFTVAFRLVASARLALRP